MQWQIGPPIPFPSFTFFLSLCETATILKPASTIPRVPSSTKLSGLSSRRRLFYHIIHLLKAFPSIFVITISNFIFLPDFQDYTLSIYPSVFSLPHQCAVYISTSKLCLSRFSYSRCLTFPASPFFKTHLPNPTSSPVSPHSPPEFSDLVLF